MQVNDLVEAAAGLISVMDDLRPLDVDSYNAFYEVYKAIAAVPAADRYDGYAVSEGPHSTTSPGCNRNTPAACMGSQAEWQEVLG